MVPGKLPHNGCSLGSALPSCRQCDCLSCFHVAWKLYSTVVLRFFWHVFWNCHSLSLSLVSSATVRRIFSEGKGTRKKRGPWDPQGRLSSVEDVIKMSLCRDPPREGTLLALLAHCQVCWVTTAGEQKAEAIFINILSPARTMTFPSSQVLYKHINRQSFPMKLPIGSRGDWKYCLGFFFSNLDYKHQSCLEDEILIHLSSPFFLPSFLPLPFSLLLCLPFLLICIHLVS